MRSSLLITTFAVILTACGSAFADEKPPVPFHLQVPDPIPPNFNKCVIVEWNDEAKKITKKNGSFYRPPLTPQMIEDLRSVRRYGTGTMRLCEETNA